jgi:glycosyltransferase involved in cell wall biosynthesis
MAYSATQPTADALVAANDYWAKHGLSADGGEFVACFFGHIGHQFDLETVIEAARRLRERGRAVRFVLCGTGSRLDEYQAQARGLDNVLFPGWIGAAEIWALMRLSAVGLAPYRDVGHFTRNLPNKPAEYFSAGLPVISSLNDGVLRDLLDRHECGLVYQNGAPETLVDVLATLSDHPERRVHMSANAQALYRQSFVAETVYGEMIDFLQSVAQRFRRTDALERGDRSGSPSYARSETPAS